MIYCEKCEKQMSLISQTISKDILLKRTKVFDLYKCSECGCMKKTVRTKIAKRALP